MSAAPAEPQGDAERLAELNAIIQTVRDRVRARYPAPETLSPAEPGNSNTRRPPIQVHIADLMPVVHARDAAMGKIAAIGSVNPRSGGILNAIIQWFKKTVARSLQWFVRDQITFNREAVSALEAIMEALNEQNRSLVSLAGQTNEQMGYAFGELAARARDLSAEVSARAVELSAEINARAAELGTAMNRHAAETLGELRELSAVCERLEPEIQELKDIRKHFVELRAAWESKVATNEIQFLRAVADLQGATQHRSTLMESNFREIAKAQHTDYLGALDRTTVNIQKQLWLDFQKVRAEYGQLIHDELRIIRLRQPPAQQPPPPPTAAPQDAAGHSAATTRPLDIDYTRFAFRFRGSEAQVRQTEELYRPFFADCRSVLDIGCGRGEFLQLMREMGVPAKGIDLGAESVAMCRDKGLDAEVADLFTYPPLQTAGEFDGIFASQLVEHLEPAGLPEMIRLCAASLRRGGVLAIETPNPECLAIFATYFYLDPTHTRPVPRQLLEFYMEESGIGSIEVHEISPAVESIPELAELPESLRKRFFGGLDYAIVGRKL
jgi:2-polyprenyl-3-methyl-5-hydroxy-6-metoxy-1,4-benzoquinol methylase